MKISLVNVHNTINELNKMFNILNKYIWLEK